MKANPWKIAPFVLVALFVLHLFSQWDGRLDAREKVQVKATKDFIRTSKAFRVNQAARMDSVTTLLATVSTVTERIEHVREVRVEIERQVVPFSDKAELLGLRSAPDGWLADSSTVEWLDDLRVAAATVPSFREETALLQSQVTDLQSVVVIQRAGWDESLNRANRLDSLIVEGERLRKAKQWRSLFGSTAKCGIISGGGYLAGLDVRQAGVVAGACLVLDVIF